MVEKVGVLAVRVAFGAFGDVLDTDTTDRGTCDVIPKRSEFGKAIVSRYTLSASAWLRCQTRNSVNRCMGSSVNCELSTVDLQL